MKNTKASGRKFSLSNWIHKEGIIEEAAVSFTSAFLVIVYFSLYRQFRGIPFTELRPAITAGYMKFILTFIILGSFLFGFFCLYLNRRTILDRFLFFGGNLCLILIALCSPDSFSVCFILFLAAVVLNRYFFVYRNQSFSFRISEKSGYFLLCGSILLYSAAAAGFGIIRHRIFLSSGNDLGTFDQMFYSMEKTLKPLNTITGVQINQFTNIHFSPILYLLLPGYLIFKSPEYLIYIQSLFTGLAAIPLFKLCRLKNLSVNTGLLISLAFLLQPGILGGQFKDFHENALLPFFLFCFIYFFEKHNLKITLLFLLLTLTVKEDAVIYPICFGLYALFQKKYPLKHIVLVIGSSILYFVIVSNFILDTGTFAYRYSNIILDQTGGSFLEIIKVLFTNPLYLLTQCFTSEKLLFMGWIFLPLALIPLSGLIHLSEIFLFLPMVFINLLPTFYGQYSINFQYNFGTIALFVWISIRRFSSIQKPQIRNCLVVLMFFSALIFSASFHGSKTTYFSTYRDNLSQYQKMEQALKQIPQDAVVTASNHIYPHLSARDEIYSPGFHSGSDYIAVDLRGSDNPADFSGIKALITGNGGYRVVEFSPDWYLILEKGISGATDLPVIEYLKSRIKE